jgi:3-oxoacyl-[acyl-carrier protein] reductase
MVAIRAFLRAISGAAMIDPGLKKKVILITGANNPHGIGAGVARAFAAQGSRLFLHSFRQRNVNVQAHDAGNCISPSESFYRFQQTKSADEVLTAVRAIGAEAYAWEADLSQVDQIPALFDQVERLLGPVEVLVNNAAYWEGDTFLPPDAQLRNKFIELWTDRSGSFTGDVFDRVFAVNTRATALMMREFAHRHIQRGAQWGRIINISTDGAEYCPSEVTYAASKFALESYTRSAATELGKFGINVNVLSLGPVQTGWITPELEREILPTIPLGKIGAPEDIADVVVFLASKQARWVTGQRIYVGGGHGM